MAPISQTFVRALNRARREVNRMSFLARVVAFGVMGALLVPVAASAAPKKRLDEDGGIPARWNLTKPVAQAHDDREPRPIR